MKYAFLNDKIVPFNEAKISIMTHAFNYGTAVFEGIRGYWNDNLKKMFILRMKEHYERLQKSASAIRIDLKYSLDEMLAITLDLASRNAYQQDIYIRPIAYKSQEKIGLGLKGVDDSFCLFIAPFGTYFQIDEGLKVCISPWRRIPPECLPLGCKLNGAYVNSSLAKSDALERGFDEAILLSTDGTVAEGSGENIFIVKDNKLITPPLIEIILPGITRQSMLELAKNEMKIETVERFIQRDELFSADELFFCGTGAEISPIIEVDGRKIKDGKAGPITKKLKELYFKAVKGDDPKYSGWVTPAY